MKVLRLVVQSKELNYFYFTRHIVWSKLYNEITGSDGGSIRVAITVITGSYNVQKYTYRPTPSFNFECISHGSLLWCKIISNSFRLINSYCILLGIFVSIILKFRQNWTQSPTFQTCYEEHELENCTFRYPVHNEKGNFKFFHMEYKIKWRLMELSLGENGETRPWLLELHVEERNNGSVKSIPILASSLSYCHKI